MLPPNSIPAQSRLLTSIIATFFLLTALISSQSQLLVNAIELQRPSEIDNSDQSVLHTSLDALAQLQGDNAVSDRDGGYAPDFDYFDRSLLGRQEPQKPLVNELKNNNKTDMEINPARPHTLYSSAVSVSYGRTMGHSKRWKLEEQAIRLTTQWAKMLTPIGTNRRTIWMM
jgi:hypothetical protein